jgi:hypothetical protein
MISIRRSVFASLLIGCTLVAGSLYAQGTVTTTTTTVLVPAPAFAYPLGTMPLGTTGASCSVQATAPRASAAKSQQMKFVVEYTSPKPGGANFRYYVISTGKSKSLAQVQAMFADGFARAASVPAGTELCKLGDVTLGGEVRLVARGNGETELIYNPTLSSGNPVFSPAESAAFAQILH